MRVSRRELGWLLPAAAALAASPRQAAPASPAQKLTTSRMYHHAQIPYEGNATKKARQFFLGQTHGGFNVEVHETILGPGVQTHDPHKHVHEEIMVLMEGTLETYVEGKREPVETGSVIFFGSNQMHTVRNSGQTPARYYVIELRGDQA
jgi:uncharacterized cupin superfamily protein